jgi:methylated-DNA-[protein]-cysteine S-methyltransferase
MTTETTMIMTESLTRVRFDSAMGPVVVTATDDGIIGVDFATESVPPVCEGSPRSAYHANLAITQLQEYFSGSRQAFDVPLVFTKGTVFQRAVWQALCEIPYGETRTYRDIARAIGNEKAVRAVGQANRANPFPIIVPCHRVIGANGGLVGYAGSQVHLKSYLLEHERAHVARLRA